MRKGRHEDQDKNIKQIKKDKKQAEQAKLAYTGPSFQSGKKLPLTWAEKKAKYRKKMKTAPPGTPEYDKWQAHRKADAEKLKAKRNAEKETFVNLEDAKNKAVRRAKKRVDKVNAEKQKVERASAR